jgi:hypothetical protein
MSLPLAVFVWSNLAIAAAYGTVGATVAPWMRAEPFHVRTPRMRKLLRALIVFTTVGAIIFFPFCAYTHLENASHALSGELAYETATAPHMVWTHLIQAVGTWMFVGGLAVFTHWRRAALRTPPP